MHKEGLRLCSFSTITQIIHGIGYLPTNNNWDNWEFTVFLFCNNLVIAAVEMFKVKEFTFPQVGPQLELKALPCGECQEPVSVSCLGQHEVTNVPCHRARPYPCGRKCGRKLLCRNHNCGHPCHQVADAPTKQVVRIL